MTTDTQTESHPDPMGTRILYGVIGGALVLTGMAGLATGFYRPSDKPVHEKPIIVQSARTASGSHLPRSQIYELPNSKFAVTYLGEGIEPDTEFTSGDRSMLESTIRQVAQEAFDGLENFKGATIFDRMKREKDILKRVTGKDRHLSGKEALKGGYISSLIE